MASETIANCISLRVFVYIMYVLVVSLSICDYRDTAYCMVRERFRGCRLSRFAGVHR
jgi:hypothetical protein